MPQLTYITTCKGRLAHLKVTLPRAVALGIPCVVVDYSCPEGAGNWVEANFPGVTVVRVDGQSGFNAAKARNAGMAAATTPWCLFADADVLLAPKFAEIVTANLAPGRFYRASPVTAQTWGTIVCRREDFAAVGGYDEAYEGWGGEDDDLIRSLLVTGRKADVFAATLLGEVAHTNQERTRFHEIDDLLIQQTVNHTYMSAKFDLWRLVGKPLPMPERKAMYDKIKRAVLAFDKLGRGKPIVIDFAVPRVIIEGPVDDNGVRPNEVGVVQRKLTYTVTVQPKR
jgi:glycosyltransferase involved in cell wall biosynthesis